MKQGDISEFGQALGIFLDSGQIDQLERFEELLHNRAIPAGMISSKDAHRLRERHVLDSLRAGAPEVLGIGADSDGESLRLADLGSGAGLPGVVLAIAMPGHLMTMIEKRPKRAAFLELAVQELRLQNASVFAHGVESWGTSATPDHPLFDVCFSRAFLPVEPAWQVASGLLGRDGRLVYFAGARPANASADAIEGLAEVEKSAKVIFETCSLLESAGPLVIMTRK